MFAIVMFRASCWWLAGREWGGAARSIWTTWRCSLEGGGAHILLFYLPRLNILTLHQVGPQQPEARPAAVQLLPGEGSAETRPQCAPQEPEENQETEKFQETKQDESSEEEAVASMDFILYVEFSPSLLIQR